MHCKGIPFFFFLLFLFVVSASGFTPETRYAQKYPVTERADTVKKANLLKRLSDALKFRKNAITREQKRVQAIIERMIAKDSSIATVQDLDRLRLEMSDGNKALMDTLLQLIREIKIPEAAVITPGGDQPSSGPGGPKPFKVTKELDPNDQYINDLVDRLMPVLEDSKASDEQAKERRKKLTLMRGIYANKNTFTNTINDTTAVRYRVKLAHRAEVIGHYLYGEPYKANSYNLSTLSTLAYSSYELDGFTGMAKNFSHWGDASIVEEARQSGNKIWLTVTSRNSAEIARFLVTPSARKNMISNTLDMIERRNADGINISLSGLNKKLRLPFANFIKELSKASRAGMKQYEIGVTLPAFDDADAYDLLRLDTLVDKFLIDFSRKPTKYPGPIAPLTDDSGYSIESSVSRYLNSGVPPYKFILGLSYRGARFTLNDAGVEKEAGYLPYNRIISEYPYAPFTFNEAGAYATIETRDADGNLTGHIYYDNALSLEKKYDFVLENGLGGVSISYLGADEGYGELWDALVFKFTKIDTVSKEVIRLRGGAGDREEGLWGYVKRNVVAYYHALQHPCDIAYDSPETLLLTILNVLLGLISVVTAVVLVYQIRSKGEKWRWKKTLIRVLIVSVNLFIITMFMWLYIDNGIPWFGAGENCVDMPFTVLLLIIIVGILLGTLVMRFLIFPVLQHDERP